MIDDTTIPIQRFKELLAATIRSGSGEVVMRVIIRYKRIQTILLTTTEPIEVANKIKKGDN